jgi:hypothetical protein
MGDCFPLTPALSLKGEGESLTDDRDTYKKNPI